MTEVGEGSLRNDAARRLAGPEYARLWERARARLERNGLHLDTTVSLPDPSDEERRALAGLLGRPRLPAKSTRVALTDVDRALRGGALGAGLVDWLGELGGPLRDRRSERAREETRMERVWTTAEEHPLAVAPWVSAWLEDLRRDGLLKRLAPGTEDELLDDALAVLARLPCDEVALPVLAGVATGDSKRLTDSALATVVERGLAAWAGVPRPRTAGERRSLWARFGVVFDDLSSQVLVLDLPARGIGMAARWLSDARTAGEPFRVTLRQLVNSDGLEFESEPVRICENVAVVMEAANQLGSDCGALVCTEGQPSEACHRLLGALRDAGCRLSYHGDFDWPGVRMVAAMVERHAAAPWRMAAGDYESALSEAGDHAPALGGTACATPWDPRLAESMTAAGRAVLEEHVLDDLLSDLAVGR